MAFVRLLAGMGPEADGRVFAVIAVIPDIPARPIACHLVYIRLDA